MILLTVVRLWLDWPVPAARLTEPRTVHTLDSSFIAAELARRNRQGWLGFDSLLPVRARIGTHGQKTTRRAC